MRGQGRKRGLDGHVIDLVIFVSLQVLDLVYAPAHLHRRHERAGAVHMLISLSALENVLNVLERHADKALSTFRYGFSFSNLDHVPPGTLSSYNVCFAKSRRVVFYCGLRRRLCLRLGRLLVHGGRRVKNGLCHT